MNQAQKSFSRSNSIYAALDIGTSKIVCVVGKSNNKGSMEVLGFGSQHTKSVKKGLIINSSKIEEEIRFVISEAEKKSQTKISSVIVNATITNSKSNFLEGLAQVGGEQVDALHIKSAINKANPYNITEEFENLHNIIRYFEVDKEKRVIDPKNFFADQLKVNIYQVQIKKNYLNSIKSILLNADLNIEKFIATPFASSFSTLIGDEKELGTICIDLGAGTTSVCIIENNKMIFAGSVPVGGNNITYDLASGLTTSIESAERLKTLYGSVFSNPSDEHELIDVSVIGSNNNQFTQINRSVVNSFIKPRVEETLELVRQKLKEYNLHNKKYRRVVLTGGGSLLEGIDNFAKIIFDSQVRVSYPHSLLKIDKALHKPQFSTVLGMLIETQNYSEIDQFFNEKKQNVGKKGIIKGFSSWLDQYI